MEDWEHYGAVKNFSQYYLACGISIALLAGCNAPMGPLGGTEFNNALMTHCHCLSSSSTCAENDPSINPPHANFNPLPTRPVFSPPTAIPGVYTPWPNPKGTPSEQFMPTLAGTEVQSPMPNASSAECEAVSYRDIDGPGSQSNGFSLRR
jgi:hypothetical protein